MLETYFGNCSPLQMKKNAFYFTFKAIFVRKIFIFFIFFFKADKPFFYRNKVNIKVFGITTWEINNCSRHIPQYLKS